MPSTMDQQQDPPEFILDVFSDPRSVRDVVKGPPPVPLLPLPRPRFRPHRSNRRCDHDRISRVRP